MKFLIVDDFPTMRRIVSNMIKTLNANIIIKEAEDGQKALEVLEREPIDFVLTDWNMPVMDGLELLKSIRANDKLKSLPVMLITAEAKKENIVLAAQTGADGYIVKPFTEQTLSDKIEKILDKKHLPKIADIK